MPLPDLKEEVLKVAVSSISGAVKGGAVGVGLSLATGAAVIATAPAWVPFVGGTAAVSATTVGVWSVCGAAVGAISNGAATAYKTHKTNQRFAKTFGEQATSKERTGS